jgi:hypothetical protein
MPKGRGFFLRPADLTTLTRLTSESASTVQKRCAAPKSDPFPPARRYGASTIPTGRWGHSRTNMKGDQPKGHVPRPSCEGSTLPFLLTVCTLKDALMLLTAGSDLP